MISLLSALAVAALAVVSQSSSSSSDLFADPVIKNPAFDAAGLPDRAVDHVIETEVMPIAGPRRTERYRRTRLGSRYSKVRLDLPDATPQFTDLATRTHVTFGVGPDGKYKWLRIARPETGTYSTYRREKTGERDRALGEDCDVWATTRVGEKDYGYKSVFLTCYTDDGIELWTRIRKTRGAKVEDQEYSRTVLLQRRSVPLGEVLPPRDLLDRSRWSGFSAVVPPPSQAPVAHEVRLEGGVPYEPESVRMRIIRESYPWSYQENARQTGERDWYIVNRATGLVVRARQYADGSPKTFDVYHHGREIPEQAVVELGRTDTVLGEQCRWVKPARDDHHEYMEECRTADGVVLLHKSGNTRYGGDSSLKAVSVRRGAISPAKLLPPPKLMSPRSWQLWP